MSNAEPLFLAIKEGDAHGVESLLRAEPTLSRARDGDGATPLHYATEHGDRAIVQLLLDAGAEINARDSQFDATPTGWAIEYLRERGGLLAIEIEDMLHAIRERDAQWSRRLLRRAPALASACDAAGKPLAQYAAESGQPEIIRLFNKE